jgi:hypothetical protein
MTTLAPIALFVYNRPRHTRQTVDALLKNELAGESDLFIFSDAPKKPEFTEAVQEVRGYIKTISGFRSVTIFEREKNFGLAHSIIDGVTRLCDEHGRVIVLEDDLVTSPYFLKYMNDALDLYEHDERVICIHGYTFPVEEKLAETFFLRGADCWGWATWKRGWDLFEPDGNALLAELGGRNLKYQFDYNGAYDFTKMLEGQISGKNDSWAIRWHASAFLKEKLTLYPGRSLVHNIGNDNSGSHCGTTTEFDVKLSDTPIIFNNITVEPSQKSSLAFENFLRKMKKGLLQRLLLKIRALWMMGTG